MKVREKKETQKRNIVWHDGQISRKDWELQNGHKAAVVWLTGLSGSGKSTLAVETQQILFKKGIRVFVLDGDNVRHGLNKNLGFSAKDREENIRRVSEVAKIMTDAGILVITAFISPYRKDRNKARKLMDKGRFIEVFVDASLDVCEKRDTKGLYKKARAGEIPQFTGISDPYDKPTNPELIINTEKYTVRKSALKIISHLKEQKMI